MANVIEGHRPGDIKAYGGRAPGFRGKDKASGNTSLPGPSEDRVSLSPMAKEVQMAKNQLQAVSDVRIDKVTAIKNRIALGTYQIDSEKIAHRIMNESLLNELMM